MTNYKNIINKFKNKKILVVGDLILDQYIQGKVSRISQEAPVPVVLQDKAFYTLGGAANVANNLKSLGARILLVGVIGSDVEGRIFKKELARKKINASGIFTDTDVPTILKTRVMAQHQQVVRIDREKIQEQLDKKLESKIIAFLKENIPSCDALIISDYGKGVISSNLVSLTCQEATKHKKVIIVDPKDNHFNYYKNVTAITPNLREIENAVKNIKITSDTGQQLRVHVEKLKGDQTINLAGQELLKYLGLESLLVTLGEAGMRLFEKGKKPVSIDTKAREVFDVSGAGDTVVSVFTLGLTAGATKRQAADIANSAAGVVVGKMGAVAITKEELLDAIKDH